MSNDKNNDCLNIVQNHKLRQNKKFKNNSNIINININEKNKNNLTINLHNNIKKHNIFISKIDYDSFIKNNNSLLDENNNKSINNIKTMTDIINSDNKNTNESTNIQMKMRNGGGLKLGFNNTLDFISNLNINSLQKIYENSYNLNEEKRKLDDKGKNILYSFLKGNDKSKNKNKNNNNFININDINNTENKNKKLQVKKMI